MKLKDDYILYNASEDETLAVAAGDEAANFKGLMRANKTAGAIMEFLREEMSEDELVNKMMDRFDGSEEDIRAGVAEVLDKLRKVGAIEE